MLSRDLYDALRAGLAAPPDLAISSAADLQVKLVNDGLALEHQSSATAQLPAWANWRNQAFGITAEPAVIVYSSKLAAESALPRSRQALIQLIQDDADALQGRLASYDIATSGVGYLFASHDSLYSSTFTTLMQSFGRVGIRLYCCTGDMLDAIERGDVLIGYNLLGSYALSRKMRGSPIEIVMPEDYTLWLSRVALIPRGATHPDLGRLLLDYLLSAEGQSRLGTQTVMGSLAAPARDTAQVPGILSGVNVQAQPIALNPSLLVFLDHMKQERFIRSWRALIAVEP
jgi:two-component system sensor histidine kinase TctE